VASSCHVETQLPPLGRDFADSTANNAVGTMGQSNARMFLMSVDPIEKLSMAAARQFSSID
jgi:hypothetical protein